MSNTLPIALISAAAAAALGFAAAAQTPPPAPGEPEPAAPATAPPAPPKGPPAPVADPPVVPPTQGDTVAPPTAAPAPAPAPTPAPRAELKAGATVKDGQGQVIGTVATLGTDAQGPTATLTIDGKPVTVAQSVLAQTGDEVVSTKSKTELLAMAKVKPKTK